MAGSIGVTASEAGRYTAFAASMVGLDVPPGSQVIWGLGMDVVANRNYCVRQMLARPGDEWLWFMDDDHAFPADVLVRLLAHDVDAVGCLYLKRQPPFDATCYRLDGGDEYVPLRLDDCPANGLERVWAVGTAGLLVRRRIFEEMEPPWFAPHRDGEDAGFCERLRGVDVPIYVDLQARLGHLTACAIWPTEQGGRWLTRFNIAGLKLARPR